ncbi:MAG TPA: squalene synthase HpnC [Pirellulales bacterium]|nr:squalene synthase HpnC [Pirellulales bacterium]
MTSAAFTAELARHGPASTPRSVVVSLDESFAYCRALAETHYENFVVASRLLPRPLRQHFANVYAYCRWADDLADETSDTTESLTLLDWWESQLDECYAGRPRHPVFVALAHTVRTFDIPADPLRDLLDAFRQDQHVVRYETFDELLDYCRRSANPVGRLVLYLGRSHDDERGRLSDSICTGLQLANFWQDVAHDWRRGRIYVPQEDCRRHGYDEADFAAGRSNVAFRGLMEGQVARAEEWLRAGLPLVERLPGWLSGDVWLMAHGGLKILQKIRAVEFDVWSQRPVVSRWDQMKLLAGLLVRRLSTGRR